MTDHGFENLGDTIRRLGITLPTGPLAPDEAEPVPGCSRCLDVGWLSRRGVAVECPCGLILQRRTERVFSMAQVPPRMQDWSLDSFAALSGKRQLVADVRAVWEETDRWPVLTGPVGVGKTGVAVSLLNEHLAAGLGGLYIVTPTLLGHIRSTYDDAADTAITEATVLTGLVQTPLLVLDDVGVARLTEWGREKLYTVINERFIANRRTIVTTNLDPANGDLSAYLGAPAFDRLRGQAEIFRLTGESLRGRPVPVEN